MVFGHHFAAIGGRGRWWGPVLAAQFGYLPGALWILVGGHWRRRPRLGGHVLLDATEREVAGQMVKEEIGTVAG